MGDKAQDLVLAVAIVGIGLFVLIDIRGTEQTGYSVIESITFGTMPSIYAGLLIGLAVLFGANAVHGLLRERATRPGAVANSGSTDGGMTTRERRRIVIRTGGTVVSVLVYALLLKHVHFLALTMVFLFLMFQLYGQRSLLGTGVVAGIGAAALHTLFITVLKLPI